MHACLYPAYQVYSKVPSQEEVKRKVERSPGKEETDSDIGDRGMVVWGWIVRDTGYQCESVFDP